MAAIDTELFAAGLRLSWPRSLLIVVKLRAEDVRAISPLVVIKGGGEREVSVSGRCRGERAITRDGRSVGAETWAGVGAGIAGDRADGASLLPFPLPLLIACLLVIEGPPPVPPVLLGPAPLCSSLL